ncbi:circadian clock protein KaiA [Tumidithrix elongata RA019]|uniref:Circadian clock oscillator protein KaiA n=1 Tax=Tumidithrix elongata BACA0141 TaxID=2716417 RepID=A0AAW9PYK1_9CYAN|nr:circadian clock protein KaiA [Tumidithrix elongata RA019]
MSLPPVLQVCCLVPESQSLSVAKKIEQFLPTQRYNVTCVSSLDTLQEALFKQDTKQETPQECFQDCLITWGEAEAVIHHLSQLGIFLPTVMIQAETAPIAPPKLAEGLPPSDLQNFYKAVLCILPEHLSDLPTVIEQAISTFLRTFSATKPQGYVSLPNSGVSLSTQQQRLAEKLKERLGYLGVYYKRDPRQFFRHLPDEDKQIYLDRLNHTYRSIILEYFKDKPTDLNQKIDEFVNLAFFGDISVSQVLELHMNLMDEFAKFLKLEGRSEEVLLDYRITLIDIIAHLCELYRRSIPRGA